MQPKLVANIPTDSAKVLVLGPVFVARLIAEGLEKEGFPSLVVEEELPRYSDPNALVQLRKIFSKWTHAPARAGAFGGRWGSILNTVSKGIPSEQAVSPPERPPQSAGVWVHPGVSVWAERPEFQALGQELGITLICPPAKTLALFGNKLNFFQEAENFGIPHLIVTFEPMSSVREIEKFAFLQDHKFPITLRAVKGWGSGGTLTIHQFGDVKTKVPLWLEQLRSNYGEALLVIERNLEGARQILIPFARLPDGTYRDFPSVDVSLQLKNRKFIEMSSTLSLDSGLDSGLENTLRMWTRTFVEHVQFQGVGSLEFKVDGTRAFLVDGSARLNADFHLWESLANTSAVAWQLAAIDRSVAEKLISLERSELTRPKKKRYGAALRFYAEDPVLQLPQPGTIRELSERREWILSGPVDATPGEGVEPHAGTRARLTLSYHEGETVNPKWDGLLGVLWVWADKEKEVSETALKILNEIWIAGSLQTNQRFLSELLSHPWVREGIYYCDFINEEFLPALRPSQEYLALFVAVVNEIMPGKELSQDSFRWSVGDQWVKPEKTPLVWEDSPKRWRIHLRAPGISGIIEAKLRDTAKLRVCAYPIQERRWLVQIGVWTFNVRAVLKVKTTQNHSLVSLLKGYVDAVLFREGSIAEAHDPIVVVKSLGVLIPHALPEKVRMIRWKVNPGQQVELGEVLAEFKIIRTEVEGG